MLILSFLRNITLFQTMFQRYLDLTMFTLLLLLAPLLPRAQLSI